MDDERPAGNVDCLLIPILEGGRLCYRFPPLEAVREHALDGMRRLPPRYRRLVSADAYPVAWSGELKSRFEEMRKATAGPLLE